MARIPKEHWRKFLCEFDAIHPKVREGETQPKILQESSGLQCKRQSSKMPSEHPSFSRPSKTSSIRFVQAISSGLLTRHHQAPRSDQSSKTSKTAR